MSEKDIADKITKYDLLFESRLSKVESTSDMLLKLMLDIKHDLRWGFGIIIGLIGILFTLYVKAQGISS